MKYTLPNNSAAHKIWLLLLIFAVLFCTPFSATANKDTTYYNLLEMGIKPNTGEDITPLFNKALETIKKKTTSAKPVSIYFEPGRYDFFPEKAVRKELYISNHDQDNPKTIGLLFEHINHFLIDGKGAELIFHGRMLPVAIEHVQHFTIKNINIDFDKPQICQVEVLANDTTNGVITFQTAPWVQYQIRDSVFYNQGLGWENNPTSCIAFDKRSRHIVFNTSDVRVPARHVVEVKKGVIKAFNWKNRKLVPGTVLAMRSWQRPAPGLFLDHGKNVAFENVKVHYAEGMGLLAQVSENISLNGFGIMLRGDNDPRYFTTQADATHFSGCRGKITSVHGVYEGMMDDAINVHGTYLKVTKQKDAHTLIAQYMHSQSYGFEWGLKGDEVQFITSATMELTGKKNRIKSIKALDKPTFFGAKIFELSFENALDKSMMEADDIGIENLSWTPEVYFANNVIRNNRARGSLFSTPKKTVVENNLFDHTSGSAILLCGDCNGWYETGACRSVVIRNNKFVNALTNMFQFTNAVISVYPEIPDLKNQEKFFHSGIIIENNTFETFDRPLVYAKSVDGLVFKNNKITTNKEFPAFHWNTYPFLFERVVNYKFSDNSFDYDFKDTQHIKINNQP